MEVWMYTFIALATTLAPLCLAYPTYQESLPNGGNLPHPCKPNYRWPGVGHLSPLGGGALNPFGEDFKRQGYVWTLQLCQMDSDGDGLTNGQELGDPQCTWQPGQIPQEVKGTSHPGVCDPYDAPQCRGRNDFVSCELDVLENCDGIDTPDVITRDITFLPHTIPNTETNYMCMTFDLPSDQDYHLLATEPIIDNQDVVHHMVIAGCRDPDALTFDRPTACGMQTDGCSDILGGWAVGSAGACYGDNIGFRVGKSQYSRVLLQLHYNNPELRADYSDASGLKLHLKPSTPELLDLVSFPVGQRILEIPPGQSRVTQVGFCPGSCTGFLITKPAYIVSARNHMHYLGKEQKIELFRNGQLIAELTNDSMFSYDSPIDFRHDPPVQLLPGDEIKTTCVYSSLSSKRWVYYGDGTQDEMCLGMLYVYPKDAIREMPSLVTCLAVGPMIPSCDLALGTPINQCDWKVFVNRTHPDTQPWWTKVTKDCNLDGFCRPECKEIADVVNSHPCMQGDIAKSVNYLLQMSKEGTELLGKLYSCSTASLNESNEFNRCPEAESNYVADDARTNVAAICTVMYCFLASLMFRL